MQGPGPRALPEQRVHRALRVGSRRALAFTIKGDAINEPTLLETGRLSPVSDTQLSSALPSKTPSSPVQSLVPSRGVLGKLSK